MTSEDNDYDVEMNEGMNEDNDDDIKMNENQSQSNHNININNPEKSIAKRDLHLNERVDSNDKFERFKGWIVYNLKWNYINWHDINNGLLSNKFIDQYFNLCHYSQVKGWLFEYLCKFILIKKYKTHQVYLNNEIPPHLRHQLNIPSTDKGIDIIFCDSNNNNNNNNSNNNQLQKWIAVQCKYRSKHQNVHISKEYISDFIHELKLSKQFKHGIIMTNVENITPRFDDENIQWFLSFRLKEIITEQFLKWIISTTNGNINSTSNKQKKTITLRDYQTKAIKSLLESDTSRKQCIMPCGTGKTIVMLYYLLKKIKSQTKKKILFLFPSLQLINQIYQAFVDYVGTTCKTLCICSQMDKVTLTQDEEINDKNAIDIYNEFIKVSNVPFTTDINKINKFLSNNNNDNLFVFSTYHSSDLLKGFNFNIAIYDEAHKTTSKCFGKTLKNTFSKINERIFFTATPKYYKQKSKRDKDLSEIVAMNNSKLYGKEIFKYSFRNAINDEYILDYQLFLCYHYLDHDANYLDLLQKQFIQPDELIIDDSNLLLSAFMLAKCIKQSINNNNNKISKILTYHNSIKSANEFVELLKYAFVKCKINKKYEIFMMSGKMKISQRKETFYNFEHCEIGIICSSRVLNEGVDLPFVDTIMFVEPRRSTIDIIQCIGRGLRLYGDLEKCNILLPIYYDELTKVHNFQCILQILITMIEYDKALIVEFTKNNYKKIREKIKMFQFNLNEEECDEEEFDDSETINDKIFNELRTMIIQSQHVSWEYRKVLLFEYCNINKQCPNQRTKKYKNVNIGQWLNNTKKKIKSKQDDLYVELATNKYVKEYINQFLLNKNKKTFTHDESKQLLFDYCNENKECPNKKTLYNDNYIGQWLNHQKQKIKSKDNELYIKLAVNEYVKKSLDEYLSKKNYFDEHKQLLFEYCNKNQKCPAGRIQYKGKKIGQWLMNVKMKLNSQDDDRYIKLAQNEYVKQSLNQYLLNKNKNKNTQKFTFDESKQLLFEYCNINKKCPTCTTKYKQKTIGNWLNAQKQKISSKQDDLYIKLTANKYVKKSLDEYLCNKNKNKNKSRSTFDESKQLLFEYCNENDKHPSCNEIYKNKNIGKFLHHQKEKIKSKEDDRYITLAENQYVKKSLDEYLSNKNKNKNKKRFTFDESKQLLFEYCNINQKCPTWKIKFKNKNIGQWLNGQKNKIKSKEDNLYITLAANKYVKQTLDEYLSNKNKNKNKKRFTFDESKKLLFEYCNINQKCPSQREKKYKNNNLGGFLQGQKKKIKSKEDDAYIKLAENEYVKQSLDEFLLNKNKNKKNKNGKKRKQYDEYKKDVTNKQPLCKKAKKSTMKQSNK